MNDLSLVVLSDFGAPKHGTELGFLKGSVPARGTLDERLALWREGPASWGYPAPLGNMIVGQVVESGSAVTNISVGDRVAVYSPSQAYLKEEALRCWKLPDSLSWQSAVCLDPADFAFAGIRDGNVRIGDAVAVFGLGAIGLLALRFAVLSGASPVIGVDSLPSRRDVAIRFGASAVVDPDAEDAGRSIKEQTHARGVDVAIDFRGRVESLQHALRAVAFGGNVVAGAMPGPYPAGLDLGAEAHLNRPNLIFSRACSDPNRDHPRWDEARILSTCKAYLLSGQICGDHLIDRVVPFADFREAYLDVAQEPWKQIKLGIRFGDSIDANSLRPQQTPTERS